MSVMGHTTLLRLPLLTSPPSCRHRPRADECGDLAVAEAELRQDLPRVLAEARHAAADGAAGRAVGPHREAGVAALDRAALDELRMARRLARRDAQIHR